MNETNAVAPPSQPPHNPLSINIEFNINNARGTSADVNHLIRGKKLDSDILNLKNHLCACQVSKTPELAQTDREGYSKEMEYLRPVDDRRRKSKRNSMDINATNRSINQLPKGRFSKGNTMVLKKSDPLPLKQDAFKKKRSHLKSDLDPYRKPTVEPREVRSLAMESRSEKKPNMKSLKNFIHKIVDNELNKRSLSGITSSKAKSPYQTPSFALTTARKRTNKKKNFTCKSERGIGMQNTSREEIVQKLNSLKSMTNSILRSEVEELQMPYYSKQRGKIRIQTDHSIDFLDEIAFYEKKTKQRIERRDAVNRAAVDETNKLIETYIQLMNEEERDQNTQHQIQKPDFSIEQMEESETVPYRPENPKKIKDIISNQMRQLFDRQELTQDLKESGLDSSGKAPPVELQKISNSDNLQKLRAFMSSEMERPATVSSQLQRMKLQQLKKQEIEKWGYLLQFIKKNMHSEEADTETVLNEVYWFLERSKNDLQRDLHGDMSIEHQKKSPVIDDDFTVKYSEKREENENNQYYQEPEQQLQHQQSEKTQSKEMQEEVASFKEEYTEQNEDLKLLSLETISSALKQRQVALDRQRDKETSALQQKRQSGRLTQQEYVFELAKIQKWTKKQLAEIKRAKKNIWKGYHEAKGVLQKTVNSRYFQEHQNSTKKMMKCLSETYLKKPKVDYKKLLQREKSNQSSSRNSQSEADLSIGQVEYEQQKIQPQPKKQALPKKQAPKVQPPKSPEQQEHSYHSSSSAEVNLEHSGQFRPHNASPNQESDHDDEEGEQVSRSQQMEEIKQRLLRMKRQHYGIQDEHSPQEQIDNHINYQEIQRSLEQEYSDEEISIINNEVGHSFLPNRNSELEKFKQLQNKLKYCCAEDKEDIFEFIFLDLCIELYQEPCKDNKIMKSINDHVNRVKNQAKKKKGVKTNLNVVKEYLKRFTAFLIRTNKNCLQNLNLPMGPTALEMLRYMHDSDYDIPEEEEEVPTLIIPIAVFDKFQQSLLPTLEFQEYYDDPDKEQARVNFLKTILHIHNKALFDSLNEFMDHERPFGIWGKPFPWKKSSSFTHQFSDAAKQQKLKKAAEKVVEQCSYVCGLLVDKQESLVGNAKISDTYVEQIREDRLSRMLANELVESEQRWLFYDDEETEVLVEISTYVWNMLIYQVRNEVSGLHRIT